MVNRIKSWIKKHSDLYFILSTLVEVALIDIVVFVIVNYFRSIWRLIGFGIGLTLIFVAIQFAIYCVSLGKRILKEEI